MKIAGTILLAAVPLALLCLASGCGSGDGYSTAQVSGTLTIDGKAVPGIVVTFQPIPASGQNPGPGSAGKTDENGKFTLRFSTKERKPGAVVGKHRVTFVTWRDQDSDVATIRDPPELVPRKYLGQPMDFEVKAGGTDRADFALTSK